MKIEFKDLRNDRFTYMGISADMVKSIVADDVPVGIVYLSEGMDENTAYIEWIEFLDVFQSKHLLRPVMESLSGSFGKLVFESQEDLCKKYKAIGAKETDYDEEREMYSWEYKVS